MSSRVCVFRGQKPERRVQSDLICEETRRQRETSTIVRTAKQWRCPEGHKCGVTSELQRVKNQR